MTAPLNSNSPHVPPIEDAKQGIQTFAMFHYQSLLDAGFDVASAKAQTANLLEQQYHFFCEQGSINPKNLGSVESKVAKVAENVKELAKKYPELRKVYTDIISIQSQLKR